MEGIVDESTAPPNGAAPSAAATTPWPGEDQRQTYWVAPEPRSASPFRSAGTRARIAIVALVAIVAQQVFEIVHVLSFDRLVDDYIAGVIGDSALAAYDERSVNLLWLYVGIAVVCGITFLAWLSRAVDNAPALGAGTPPRGPRAAIGWWFVPFANLVVPYTIVSDLRRRMAVPDAPGRGVWIVRSWWALWIIQAIAGRLVGALPAGETVDDLRLANTVLIVSDSLTIAAAILAILVIRELQHFEAIRAVWLRASQQPVTRLNTLSGAS